MEVCTKIIICHNIKGGVGKSTTAVNLSYNLSVMGYKVLGIDLDPQKNYTPFFRQADESKTIYQLMQDPRKVKSHILRSKYKDLDLIKGSSLLSDNFQNVDQLQKVLDPVKKRYDYIIFDCRTSNEMLTKNALFICDYLLTPVLLDGYCRDNLSDEKEIYDTACYLTGREIG
ncbi:MAG: ParA family protein [Sellimonas intestinalis]